MAIIPQKIRILRFVAEQGVVTLNDVNAHLFEGDKTSSIRVALHRFCVQHTKYGNIKHGVWHISEPSSFDLIKSYYPDFPSLEVRPLLFHLVAHSLEINRIRTALEKSNQIVIDRWWPENFIRASSQGETIAFKKIPDAIFWRRRTDGTKQKFFLEYERTLKNKNRYEEIFCSYAKREDVSHKNVIYICGNEFIRKELLEVEEKLAKAGKLSGAGFYFQFVTLENFYKTYSNNPTNKEE